jgi:hypothetical protein
MTAAKRPTPIKAPKTPPPIAAEFDLVLAAELVDGRGVGVCMVVVCITTDLGEGVGVSLGGEGGEVTGVTFGKESVVGVWVTGVVTGRGGVVVVVGNEGWVVVGTLPVTVSRVIVFKIVSNL